MRAKPRRATESQLNPTICKRGAARRRLLADWRSPEAGVTLRGGPGAALRIAVHGSHAAWAGWTVQDEPDGRTHAGSIRGTRDGDGGMNNGAGAPKEQHAAARAARRR